MKDKELLELAAFAAKFDKLTRYSEAIQDYDSPHCGYPALHEDGPGGECCSWNPLTDDGDALRLAVKLHLDLRFHWDGCDDQYDEVEAYTHGAGKDAREQIGFYEREGQLDELAATRHVIVRAAAEIGKKMKEKTNEQ